MRTADDFLEMRVVGGQAIFRIGGCEEHGADTSAGNGTDGPDGSGEEAGAARFGRAPGTVQLGKNFRAPGGGLNAASVGRDENDGVQFRSRQYFRWTRNGIVTEIGEYVIVVIRLGDPGGFYRAVAETARRDA